jgi:hypothetical protein
MLNIRKKTVVLGLTVLLTIVTLVLPTYAAGLSIFTGKITRIEGNTIILNGYKKFEPANERARLPEWAAKGSTVKVGYYSQSNTNYYHEIGEPGKALEIEKESWGRSSQGDT